MADSTVSTRHSQWKRYFEFCDSYDRVPLPASLETILLYLAHLSSTLKYVSIVNYLSAVWILHRINGYSHLDSGNFEIVMTLRGIRRTIGDVSNQARPISVKELIVIFTSLDLSSSEDVAFWCAILLCFRGLLRKSNVLEPDLAILVSDYYSFHWGCLVRVRRTKTICFRERVLEIPFVSSPCSCFCVQTFVDILLRMVRHTGDQRLVSYKCQGKLVNGTYNWFCGRVRSTCKKLGLMSFTSHSLRRGGASALADAGFSLIDIKNLGDWQSLSVLHYLTRSPASKLDLDTRIVNKLFS